MFNIGEVIRNIVSGGGAGAINAGLKGGPTPPARPVIPGSEPPPAPEPPPVAESYKSPPDLVAMYTKLMEQSQRTAAFQRGATMIAAGLSPYQDTRDSLLATVGKGGAGAGTGGITMEQMINLQKLQQEQTDRAARAEQLPALGEKYGLDPATLDYLNRTDALDEVIQELSKPHTQVVDTPRSGKILINTIDGSTIKTLSPSEPRETEFIDAGGGNHILVDKATKVPVGSKTGTPIVFTGPTLAEKKLEQDIQQGPEKLGIEKGQLDVSKGNLAVAQSAEERAVQEAKVKSDSRKTRELYLPALQKQFGITEATANYLNETDALDDFVKEASKPENQIIETADGSQQLVNKNTGALVKTLSPPKDELATSKAAVAAINKEEEERGVPPDERTKLGDWIKTHGTGSGSPLVQIGPSGETMPPLDKDHRYITENGKPKLFAADENGPAGYRAEAIPGTKAALDEEKTRLEVAALKAKGDKSAAGADVSGVRKAVENTIVDQVVDDSIALLDKHKDEFIGITGAGALKKFWFENDGRSLANNLNTIKTHIGIDELKAMRADSPTGAALGNVTNYEDNMLKSVMGPMDQYNDPDTLRYDLKRYQIAAKLISQGIHDPKTPDPVIIDGKPVPNPEHMRLPTEAEVRREMNKVPKPGDLKTEEDMKESGFKVIETPDEE